MLLCSMSKSVPSSPFLRSLKLMKAASSLIGSEVVNTVSQRGTQATRLLQSHTLAKSLGELKGAAMKVGQLLSLDLSEYLPPEAVEALEALQDQAPTIDFVQMEQVMINELGFEKYQQLQFDSTKPMAAASIGQVYKAKLHGKDVVLKVQYPNIQKSIDSDIRILKRLVTPMLLITAKKMNLDAIYEEVGQVLHQETKYLDELKYLQLYSQHVQSVEGYRTPLAYPEFSSNKVLCMSYEPGLSLKDWIRSNPSEEKKQIVGNKLLNLYELEFFRWGLVQTDPNFANYLIDPNTLEVILLDFGASKEYASPFRKDYRELLKAFRNNPEKGLELALQMELLHPKETSAAKEKFCEMMTFLMIPFSDQTQSFRFDDEDYSKKVRSMVWEFMGELKYSPPPRDLLFLHRKLGGIFNALKALHIEIDVRPIWDKIMSMEIPSDNPNTNDLGA